MKRILITLSLIPASAICIAQYDLHPIDAPTSSGIHDIEITTDGTIFIYT